MRQSIPAGIHNIKETKMAIPSMTHNDALIVVDVQNDFCTDGALPIEGGETVVPVLNQWIKKAEAETVPVYASRDWHPRKHISFQAQNGPWPSHCIQDTRGAAFHPDLTLPLSTIVVTKGTRFDHDQNSVFDETGLAYHLKQESITRLFIGGLALDVCVLASAMDALANGFEVILLKNGTRAVTGEGAAEALNRMEKAGVRIIEDDPESTDIPFCTKAPEWAEHARPNEDADDTCDDGRAG